VRTLLILWLAILCALWECAQAGTNALPQSRTWKFRDIVSNGETAVPPFRLLRQAPSGLIYLVDSVGVLEFDGVHWRRLALPDLGLVTALAITLDGEVLVAGTEALFSVRRIGSEDVVEDLAAQFEGGIRGLGNIWEIAVVGASVCARTQSKLLCRDQAGYFQIATKTSFGRLFSASGQMFVRVSGVGFSQLQVRSLQLVAQGEAYAQRGTPALVRSGAQGVALITQDPERLITWDNLAQAPRETNLTLTQPLHPDITNAERLPNGQIAISERNRDLVIVNDAGLEVGRFGAASFGAASGAESVLVDREGGVWVAWANAVTRLEWPSRVSVYQDIQSADETLMHVLPCQGGVAAHGSQLIYQVRSDASSTQIYPQPPIMDMACHSDDVLVAGLLHLTNPFGDKLLSPFDLSDGLGNESSDNKLLGPRRVGPIQAILIDPADPNQLIVGLPFGLARAIRNPRWQWLDYRRDLSIDVGAVTVAPDQTIWASSRNGRLVRIGPVGGEQNLASAAMQEFGPEHGLPRALVSMQWIGDRMIFASAAGCLEYQQGAFVPSPMLPVAQTGPVAHLRDAAKNQVIVVTTSGQIRLLVKDTSGIYRYRPSTFDAISGLGRIRDVYVEPSSTLWVAADLGLVSIDPRIKVTELDLQTPLIRSIALNDAVHYGGMGPIPDIALNEGSHLRISFALPSYRALGMNRYRSRIVRSGERIKFSSWSNETRRDFTNLPAGLWRFELQARDAIGKRSSLSIALKVIAPWYRQTLAMVLWALCGLLLIWAGVQWRLRALRMRSTHLERLVAQKTEALLVAANSDALTGLANRHQYGNWLREQLPKIARARNGADGGSDIIACVIDLDHFKRVNDEHGHATGDAVLKAVANRLSTMRENGDQVFRFGGEEFVYLAVHRRRENGAAIAAFIVDEIAKTAVELENGMVLDPTASVGWSVYPFYPERADLFSLDFVIDVADRALYLAKQAGRQCARGYVPHLPLDAIDRSQADWRAQVLQRHPDLLQQV